MYTRCTTLQRTQAVFHKNLNKRDFMFGIPQCWSGNIVKTQYHQPGLSHTNFRLVDQFFTAVAAVVVEAVAHAWSHLNENHIVKSRGKIEQEPSWLKFEEKTCLGIEYILYKFYIQIKIHLGI